MALECFLTHTLSQKHVSQVPNRINVFCIQLNSVLITLCGIFKVIHFLVSMAHIVMITWILRFQLYGFCVILKRLLGLAHIHLHDTQVIV